MSKIINVVPNDDYTLLLELEQGNKILFNMERLIKTMPYFSLSNLEYFKNIKVEDKAICWEEAENLGSGIMPIRITLDNILFMIRD